MPRGSAPGIPSNATPYRPGVGAKSVAREKKTDSGTRLERKCLNIALYMTYECLIYILSIPYLYFIYMLSMLYLCYNYALSMSYL